MAILALLFSCSLATLTRAITSRGADRHVDTKPMKWDEFTAPSMVPSQFLIISSPSEKKVVWTRLDNFQTKEGRAFALIDEGLSEPKGVAFDHQRGFLYVADSGAKCIFRYTVLVDMSGTVGPKLTTTKVRVVVVKDHAVEWVTVDHDGNLFYTAPDTHNINKIPADVLASVSSGAFDAGSLMLVSEKAYLEQLAADTLSNSVHNLTNPFNLPVDRPPPRPHIFQIYQAQLNPSVSAPSCILAEGEDLYWGNEQDGQTAGTVVKGLVHPAHSATAHHTPNYSHPFPAVPLTQISNGAFGIGKTKTTMFFTQNGTAPGVGKVSGFYLHNPSIVVDFVTDLAQPRGLVWDKDQTIYVADPQLGGVWSFPGTRMMAHAPLTKTVGMKGAFGLVIMSTHDPAFPKNEVRKDDEGKHLGDELESKSSLPNSLLSVKRSVVTTAAAGAGLKKEAFASEGFFSRKLRLSLKARPTENDELSSLLQVSQVDLVRASRLET